MYNCDIYARVLNRENIQLLLYLAGKKVSVAEKMIPPAEPVEPVLCGSFAIGGTSLAVAKAGATVCRIPLYLHIALLKHDQVRLTFVILLICPSYHNYSRTLKPVVLHDSGIKHTS